MEIKMHKEEMAMDLYGRSLELSQAGEQCVKCGEFNLEFRDELSRREYAISGWCQSCQDDFFNEHEDWCGCGACG